MITMNHQSVVICIVFGLFYIPKALLMNYDLQIKGYEHTIENLEIIDFRKMKMIKLGKKHFALNGTIVINTEVNDDFQITVHACKKMKHGYAETFGPSLKDVVFCDTYADEKYISSEFKLSSKLPLKCPIPRGEYHIINYKPDTENFPSNVPPGEWRVTSDYTMILDDKREIFSTTVMYLLVELSSNKD